MDAITENSSWLNRIARSHLSQLEIKIDPGKLYILQLMRWGLARGRFQGDESLRPLLLKTLDSLLGEEPQAAQDKILKSNATGTLRQPNLRSDAEDLANELLKFLADNVAQSNSS